jgi:hypothetical protein
MAASPASENKINEVIFPGKAGFICKHLLF